MNKTAIKNFAIWARRKLISDVTYKAGMLGVSEKGIAQPLPHSTKDLQFFDIGTKDYAEVSGVAIDQRNALIAAIQVKEHGTDYKTAFQNVVEEVAYTWFNRLIAVRFMEINDYLPSHIRVLSSEKEGKLEPDFVTNPFDTDLVFSSAERDRVIQLKDDNKLDELFRMLFIKQCNKLSEILPGLFEKISDYTELLLNISFTDKDGIIYHLTHDISEDEFNVEKEGQVEIIGWMYQYYNTEPKDEVFALLKKNVKITKERIPAATQLFTPDWIVRYMVENSLGRLWVEGHPNESLKENWKYYLEEAEQEPDVVAQLKKIREEYAQLDPTDIKVIDPCMGSGHILVYAFDVLMQIYKSQGYIERDAAKSILINNLYGIDIDTRAYQLAYFAVMMKARQYNRKIFQENITPNLIAIKNPDNVSKSVLKRLGGLEPVGLRMLEDFEDAEEYGSILQVSYTADELDRIEKKLEEIEQEAQYGNLLVQMEAAECVRLVRPLVKQAKLLAQKYDVVVTNPPYMGANGMSPKLTQFIKERYFDSKSDLFAVFIEHGSTMIKEYGFNCMVTMHVWMFLSSFEIMRRRLLSEKDIVALMHMENMVMGIAFGTAVTVIRNSRLPFYRGTYNQIKLKDIENDYPYCFPIPHNRFSQVNTERCFMIPGCPVAYWLPDRLLQLFSTSTLGNVFSPRQGVKTLDNERFVRLWFECNYGKIGFGASNLDEANKMKQKWFPYTKGGEFRKWYGNRFHVVNWENDGEEMKALAVEKYHSVTRTITNISNFFRNGLTWSDISSGSIAIRFSPSGSIFDSTGVMAFGDEEELSYIIGLLNSVVSMYFLSIFAPSLHFNGGAVSNIPYIIDKERYKEIIALTRENYAISKEDWDDFEISWDFKRFCLPMGIKTVFDDNNGVLGGLTCTSWRLADCYDVWADKCQRRFDQLKANEEKLNRIFIDIYGLQDELTPEVEDKDVSVRKADLGREIRSLISYAVGCMFGRYSVYKEGLVFAGGKMEDHFSYYSGTHDDISQMTWDLIGEHTWKDVGKSFYYIPQEGKTPLDCWKVDADNCIPITDEEYFQDDIVGYFVEFIQDTYGGDYLEENLDFIASALGNRGNTSREVIRNYFLNDFYKDHCQIYSVTGSGKRPIYWLFDSGKQNGFKALVYMHRWNADTVGNLRIEYLHKMQNVYEHEIDSCQDIIDHGSGHEVAVATKRKEKLVKQMKECKDYDALVAHIAFSKIDIDLDDGVKVNYRKVQTGSDGKFCEILADSKDIMVKEK